MWWKWPFRLVCFNYCKLNCFRVRWSNHRVARTFCGSLISLIDRIFVCILLKDFCDYERLVYHSLEINFLRLSGSRVQVGITTLSFLDKITSIRNISKTTCRDYYILYRLLLLYCGRQEELAILISRLLLPMRRMYVASIRLDFH